MSRSTMLRTRRKDISIKPNRRLDRKSSRGMIYENEELRLRTININADVEKGQSDIKKLRRENEQLRREIWFIRHEYEKLENKLLTSAGGKLEDGTENSTTCSSDEDSDDSSCPSCAALKESETDPKISNRNFDHLSVVSEEKSSIEEDQRISENMPSNKITNSILGPDQSYPEIANNQDTQDKFSNFFSPLPNRDQIFEKQGPDLCVNETCDSKPPSFQSGGNLDQLLQDMDLISKDILLYSNGLKPENNFIQIDSGTPDISPQIDGQPPNFIPPYKSEINVVLVPNPMPLIGFEKYKLPEQFNELNIEPNIFNFNIPPPEIEPPKPPPIDLPSTEIPNEEINSPKIIKENFPNDIQTPEIPTPKLPDITKPEKVKKNRKLSIHFTGSKKSAKHVDTPIPPELKPPDSESKEDSSKTSSSERKVSLTSNASSLDKKHVKIEKRHKNHELKKHRKNSSKLDLISTRSGNKHDSWLHNRQYDSLNEFTSLSERERTNSLTSDSSRNTTKSRKLSTYSTLNSNGKVPWCGCWGNGCL